MSKTKGEGRSAAEKAGRIIGRDKKKAAERKALDERYNALAGPVVTTTLDKQVPEQEAPVKTRRRRTTALIGNTVKSGHRCSNCDTTYRKCTSNIFKAGGRACCAHCYQEDTHDERVVKEIDDAEMALGPVSEDKGESYHTRRSWAQFPKRKEPFDEAAVNTVRVLTLSCPRCGAKPNAWCEYPKPEWAGRFQSFHHDRLNRLTRFRRIIKRDVA